MSGSVFACSDGNWESLQVNTYRKLKRKLGIDGEGGETYATRVMEEEDEALDSLDDRLQQPPQPRQPSGAKEAQRRVRSGACIFACASAKALPILPV